MRFKSSCVLTTVSLVLLVLSFPMPANSAGDAAQLEEHELRISDLEHRVLELEAKLRAASGSGVTLTSNPTLAAWRIPSLFQSVEDAPVARWQHTGRNTWRRHHGPRDTAQLHLGKTLRRTVRAAEGGVSINSPCTPWERRKNESTNKTGI